LQVLRATALPVVASGGVGQADDLRSLAALTVAVGDGPRRLAGAIVGKALVDGRVTMEEALAACVPSG
jgi:phosphoribosylformimino-5-aminoimidazole carboxamide ribotide isomerase